jgi:hypothetical protein
MVGASPFHGETHGADRIVALFQDLVEQFDRRFDRRDPRLESWPRVGPSGLLRFRWRVRYTLGEELFLLGGTTECRYRGARILLLKDTMNESECICAAALIERLR